MSLEMESTLQRFTKRTQGRLEQFWNCVSSEGGIVLKARHFFHAEAQNTQRTQKHNSWRASRLRVKDCEITKRTQDPRPERETAKRTQEPQLATI